MPHLTRRGLLRAGAVIAGTKLADADAGFILGKADQDGGNYVAKAVHFDGANSSLAITSLSCTDGANFSFVGWFKYNPATQVDKTVWVADPNGDYGSYQAISSGSAVGPYINLADDGFTNSLSVDSSASPQSSEWQCVIFSANTNQSAGNKVVKLYLGDTDVTNVLDDSSSAFLAAFSGKLFKLGDDGFGGGAAFDVADFRLFPNISLLTSGNISEETRRLFIYPNGKPVDPAEAAAALGTVGTILFSGDALTFPVNQGLGGAAVLSGAITNASTSPSD